MPVRYFVPMDDRSVRGGEDLRQPGASPRRHPVGRACQARAGAPPTKSPTRPYLSSGSASNSRTADACSDMHEPGSVAEASEPGIFTELVSISSTRSAGVSDSAYFIRSIELRPTFDLFLGACRELQFFGRASSGKTPIVRWFCRTHRPPGPQPTQGAERGRVLRVGCGGGVLSSLKLLGGNG